VRWGGGKEGEEGKTREKRRERRKERERKERRKEKGEKERIGRGGGGGGERERERRGGKGKGGYITKLKIRVSRECLRAGAGMTFPDTLWRSYTPLAINVKKLCNNASGHCNRAS